MSYMYNILLIFAIVLNQPINEKDGSDRSDERSQ